MTFRGTPEPTWSVNTAAATLTVEICHINDAGYSLSPGVSNGPPNCLSLEPVRNGTTFRYPSPHEYLLAAVQGSKPGRAKLNTITYSYRAGTDLWSPARPRHPASLPHLQGDQPANELMNALQRTLLRSTSSAD